MGRFNINKGDRFKIAKSQGLDKIRVILKWDGDTDLDASVFMCGEDGQIINDAAFVFYNSENRVEAFDRAKHGNKRNWLKTVPPMSADGAVIGSVDERSGGSEEIINVDLGKVNPDVQEIVFVATIHGEEESFGDVANASITVVNTENDDELCHYALNEDFTNETAVVAASLTVDEDGEWNFNALGQGYEGGLETLIDIYAS